MLAHARKVVERGAEAHEEWTEAVRVVGRPRARSARSCSTGCSAATCPMGWEKALPVVGARQEGRRHPQGLRRGAQGAGRRAARAVGRLGRPRGEQQHHDGGRGLVRPEVDRHQDVGRRALRPHPALRRPRARDGRDPQRHRAARPHPPLRRHVPDVQRLHARRRAAGRADEVAGRSTCGRTTPSASARTAPPTSRSSTWPRCARSRACRCVRPGDANETAYAWKAILENPEGPKGICLTRQNLPVLEGTSAEGVARGGYVLADASAGEPQVILIGTGSELQIAVDAREVLEGDGIPTRVVSMPCVEWFDGPGPGLPRLGAAAVGEGPRLGRGRHRDAVVPLGRRRRRDRLHRALRRQRRLPDPVPRVRVHHRARRDRRPHQPRPRLAQIV